MLKAAVLGLVVTLTIVCDRSEQTADNQLDFAALCTVYRAATLVAKLQEPSNGEQEVVLASNIIDEINFLNITLAEDAFYEFGNASMNDKDDREKMKAEWTKLRESLASKVASKGREVIGTRVPDSPERRRAASRITTILRAVQRLAHDQGVQGKAYNEALRNAIQLSKQAIFGKGSPKWGDSGAVDDATFVGEGGNAWTGGKLADKGDKITITSGRGCGYGGAEAAGISIISDFTCLCIGRYSNGGESHSNNACVRGLTGFTGDYQSSLTALSSLAPGETGWGKLRAACEKRARDGDHVTPDRLKIAIEGWIGRIGKKVAKIVGDGESYANCGKGSNAADLCIHYGKYEVNGYNDIPWVHALWSAAAKLREAELAKEASTRFDESIKMHNATAWDTYLEAIRGPETIKGDGKVSDVPAGNKGDVKGEPNGPIATEEAKKNAGSAPARLQSSVFLFSLTSS